MGFFAKTVCGFSFSAGKEQNLCMLTSNKESDREILVGTDGHTVSAPLASFPRLLHGTAKAPSFTA